MIAYFLSTFRNTTRLMTTTEGPEYWDGYLGAPGDQYRTWCFWLGREGDDLMLGDL